MVPTQLFLLFTGNYVSACVRNTLVGARGCIIGSGVTRCRGVVGVYLMMRRTMLVLFHTTIGAYFAPLSLRALAPVRPYVYARMI